MTTDRPGAAKKAVPAKNAVPAEKAVPVKKPVPVKKAVQVRKTVPAKKAVRSTVGKAASILRRNTVPLNRLDAQERKDVWATFDDDSLRRNKNWEVHKAVLRLATVAGTAFIFLIGAIAVLLLVPDATIQQAIWIAGAAVGVAGGGMAVTQFVQSRRRPPPPPT